MSDGLKRLAIGGSLRLIAYGLCVLPVRGMLTTSSRANDHAIVNSKLFETNKLKTKIILVSRSVMCRRRS